MMKITNNALLPSLKNNIFYRLSKYSFWLKIICVFSILVFLSSCSVRSSFNDQNIISETKRILKEEFDINCQVKRNNHTLAVCLTIPKLYSSTKQLSPLVADYHQNVSLVLSRVLLSTDSDIRFYQVNFRGEDTGLEISLIRYVKDLKIFRMQGIAWSDYKKRMIHQNVTNVSLLGKKKIKQFFQDQGKLKPEKIIAYHFSSNIKRQNISPDFIRWFSEFSMKKDIENEIIETRVKAINKQTYLFYCKVKETFERKHGFETFIFSSSSGETQEFIFSLTATSFYNVMMSSFFRINDSIKQNPAYIEIIDQSGHPKDWPLDDFIANNMTLPEFIIKQTASRIHEKTIENHSKQKNKSLLPPILTVEGSMQNQNFMLKFVYQKRKSIVDNEDVLLAKDIIKIVCKKYKFYDIKTVLIGTLKGIPVSFDFAFD